MKNLIIACLILLSACKKENPIDTSSPKIVENGATGGIVGGVVSIKIGYIATGLNNATSAKLVNETGGRDIALPLTNGSLTVQDNAAYGTGKNYYHFEAIGKDGVKFIGLKFNYDF